MNDVAPTDWRQPYLQLHRGGASEWRAVRHSLGTEPENLGGLNLWMG